MKREKSSLGKHQKKTRKGNYQSDERRKIKKESPELKEEKPDSNDEESKHSQKTLSLEKPWWPRVQTEYPREKKAKAKSFQNDEDYLGEREEMNQWELSFPKEKAIEDWNYWTTLKAQRNQREDSNQKRNLTGGVSKTLKPIVGSEKTIKAQKSPKKLRDFLVNSRNQRKSRSNDSSSEENFGIRTLWTSRSAKKCPKNSLNCQNDESFSSSFSDKKENKANLNQMTGEMTSKATKKANQKRKLFKKMQENEKNELEEMEADLKEAFPKFPRATSTQRKFEETQGSFVTPVAVSAKPGKKDFYLNSSNVGSSQECKKLGKISSIGFRILIEIQRGETSEEISFEKLVLEHQDLLPEFEERAARLLNCLQKAMESLFEEY